MHVTSKAPLVAPRSYVSQSMARGWGLALVLSVALVVGAGAAAAAEGGVGEADGSKHGSDFSGGVRGIASSFRRLCGGKSGGGSGGDGEGRREGTAWCEAGPSALLSDSYSSPFSIT